MRTSHHSRGQDVGMVDCCPCCEGEIGERFETREMMFGTRDPFTYGRCRSCGSLVLLDPPEDLAPYYPSDYYSFRGDATSGSRLRRFAGRMRVRAYQDGSAPLLSKVAVRMMGRPAWRDRIFFPAPALDARILDVGSGAGDLLWMLWNDGYSDLVGVDPYLNPEAEIGGAGAAGDGVRLVRARLEDLVPAFDLVMFNHSLEHVPDPVAQMREARRLLASDGQLLLRVPVADSDTADRFGAEWFALDPPRHLVIPTRPAVRRIAERAGFVVESVSDDGGGYSEALSLLYRRGIPALTPSGSDVALADYFTRTELREFDERARCSNRAGRGDTSRFLLRPDATIHD